MSLEAIVLIFIVIFIFSLLVLYGIRRAQRRYRAIQARLQEIRAAEQPVLVIDHWDAYFRLDMLFTLTTNRMRAIVVMTARDLIVYDRTEAVVEQFRCRLDQIRWFGRPKPYAPGDNDIWIHAETERGWVIAQIRLYTEPMRDLVRMLKAMLGEELTIAYRRRRPYIHAGPETAFPAHQDIHGAWALDEKVGLYLMPRYVVIFRDGKPLRKIPLEHIQQIGAMRRIDQPNADGLVRFHAEEEPFAFALRDYDSFAAQLAEAAKRTLEAPLERKQKGKAYPDDDWDE